MIYPIGLFSLPGGAEWIVIAIIGLLLFGKRLPEVGRSLGKGIVEFKKGLKGVEEEVKEADNTAAPAAPAQQPMLTSAAPAAAPAQMKFDPYTGKPIEAKPLENTATTPTPQA